MAVIGGDPLEGFLVGLSVLAHFDSWRGPKRDRRRVRCFPMDDGRGADRWSGRSLTGVAQRWLPRKKFGFIVPDDEALLAANRGNLLVDAADVLPDRPAGEPCTEAGAPDAARAGYLLKKRQPVHFIVVRARARALCALRGCVVPHYAAHTQARDESRRSVAAGRKYKAVAVVRAPTAALTLLGGAAACPPDACRFQEDLGDPPTVVRPWSNRPTMNGTTVLPAPFR